MQLVYLGEKAQESSNCYLRFLNADIFEKKFFFEFGSSYKLVARFLHLSPSLTAIKIFSQVFFTKLDKSLDTLLFLDKPLSINLSTFFFLKRKLDFSKVVLYNPDTPFATNNQEEWKNFLKLITVVDLCLVPRDSDLAYYRALGAKKAVHIFPSRGFYTGYRFYSGGLKKEFDFCYFGAYLAERERVLECIVDAGYSIVLGHEFNGTRLAEQQNVIVVERNVSYGKDAACFISKSRVGVGFLRHQNNDGYNSRTFEIVGSGAALFSEESKEVRSLFGDYAIFFKLNDRADVFKLSLTSAIELSESISRDSDYQRLIDGYGYDAFWRRLADEIC